MNVYFANLNLNRHSIFYRSDLGHFSPFDNKTTNEIPLP